MDRRVVDDQKITELFMTLNNEEDEATFKPVEIDLEAELNAETLQGLPKAEVIQAMRKELESLRSFGVYESVNRSELPRGAKLVKSRWVLVRKPSGEVKARLVAKDFNDGSMADAFSSTPTQTSLRFALGLAAQNGWEVATGDFSTAFLHADIDPKNPQFLQPCTPLGRMNEAWILKKALYGLRVAPRLFQDHLAKVFKSCGVQRSEVDPSVYFSSKKTKSGSDGKDGKEIDLMIVCHVDDPLFVGTRERIEEVRDILASQMKFKKGPFWEEQTWNRFLGKEWRKLPSPSNGFAVRVPPGYFDSIYPKLAMERKIAGIATPGVAMKEKDDEPEYVGEAMHRTFRECLGKVSWIGDLRPDIQFAVKELARKSAKPDQEAIQGLKRLMRYISGTKDYCLTMEWRKPAKEIVVMTDSNWVSPKSTSGCVVLFGVCCILTHAHSL